MIAEVVHCALGNGPSVGERCREVHPVSLARAPHDQPTRSISPEASVRLQFASHVNPNPARHALPVAAPCIECGDWFESKNFDDAWGAHREISREMKLMNRNQARPPSVAQRLQKCISRWLAPLVGPWQPFDSRDELLNTDACNGHLTPPAPATQFRPRRGAVPPVSDDELAFRAGRTSGLSVCSSHDRSASPVTAGPRVRTTPQQ